MSFKESISNGYMIPTSVAVGSGEATDIRCVCDTVEDFKSFLDTTGMELRYEGLVTYEKVNKLLKVYKGNDMWQIVGEGGGSVDTSSFITLTQLSQQLNGYYTKTQTDNKISEEIAKAQIGGSGEVDLSAYATKNYVDDEISKIELKEGPQGPQGDKGDIGPQGPQGDTPSIAHLEKQVSDKSKELDTKFETLASEQQQINAEVVTARDGEVSLNARLERDLKRDKIHFVDIEGSNISTDSEEGYLENIEILGNTWQDSENLADICSVGDKVEGQELYEIPVLSCGKNLIRGIELGTYTDDNGVKANSSERVRTIDYVRVDNSKEYVFSLNNSARTVSVKFYDANKSYLGFLPTHRLDNANMPQGTYYITCDTSIADINSQVQLEEGEVVTSFEEYKEYKLTILSPVQLEKVGNVADRIVCKNGVWGVEKHINTLHILDSFNYSLRNGSDGVFKFISITNISGGSIPEGVRFDNQINNKYVVENPYDKATNSLWFLKNAGYTEIRFSLDGIETDVNVYKNALKGVYIKHLTDNIQFIPLPHDQQVKLRTFADRTYISFDTEIQPTLKAQVPKSLGATVNTHATQIDNLNKELDRVKKLEESTVTTVTSNSSFTSVAETTQGYFEDVKIEGKTLVNLCSNFRIVNMHSYQSYIELEVSPNTKYTVIVPIYANHVYGIFSSDGKKTILDYRLASVCNIFNFTSNDDTNFRLYCRLYDEQGSLALEGELNKNACDVILLEGDHTDKDISFFEGLKSVGQDTDEIVVSSVKGDGNLVEYIELNGVASGAGDDYTSSKYVRTNYITVEPNQTYYIKHTTNVLYKNCAVYFYDSNKSYLGCKFSLTSEFTTVANTKFIRIDMKKADDTFNTQEDINNCDFVVSKYRVSEYIPHQSDKKRLLYYNEETQTWEKPILREWDSIEKHADGKYYYHQRSGEVVLNGGGNEYWTNAIITSNTNTIRFALNNMYTSATKKYMGAISDKFKIVYDDGDMGADSENIGVNGYVNALFLTIEKSKLSSQDLTGFKQWLQANNVTVVYQLAEEKVYECTNIDLITYNGETNYIVESGVLSPKIILKVHSNIGNVVNLLQKKVSILENNINSYIITQNRLQLASTYAADSVTFKVDYASAFDNRSVDGYNPDLYNLILSNILVGKDNYDYNKMFSIILDYASWDQISWEQFDELVLLMDIQHNPPIEIPKEDYTEEEIPEI